MFANIDVDVNGSVLLLNSWKLCCILYPLVCLTEAIKDDEDELNLYEVASFKSPEQIADELVTLSLLPNSRWLSLIKLDIIKVLSSDLLQISVVFLLDAW